MLTRATSFCPNCGSPAKVTLTMTPADNTVLMPGLAASFGAHVTTRYIVECEHAVECPTPSLDFGKDDRWFRNKFSIAERTLQEAEARAKAAA